MSKFTEAYNLFGYHNINGKSEIAARAKRVIRIMDGKIVEDYINDRQEAE